MKKFLKFVKSVFRVCVMLAIAFALFIGISNAIVILSVKNDIVSVEEAAEKKADCIIVLGCSVLGNGQPSIMLKDRLDTAIELYKAGAAPKILMSGDHMGEYYNEVSAMKKYAISCGVPSEDIFLDHYGLSTYESMYRADSVFQLKNVIVVTQEYHLSRSVYNAQQFGMEAIGVSALKVRYGGQTFRDIREMCSRTKDFVFCIIKPQPRKMSGVIPVVGNGDVTNEREE